MVVGSSCSRQGLSPKLRQFRGADQNNVCVSDDFSHSGLSLGLSSRFAPRRQLFLGGRERPHWSGRRGVLSCNHEPNTPYCCALALIWRRRFLLWRPRLWRRWDWPRSADLPDRKSTRLNSSHLGISYAVFCLKKKRRHFSACTL